MQDQNHICAQNTALYPASKGVAGGYVFGFRDAIYSKNTPQIGNTVYKNKLH